MAFLDSIESFVINTDVILVLVCFLLFVTGIFYLMLVSAVFLGGHAVMDAIREDLANERAERVRECRLKHRIRLRSVPHRPMKRLRPRYRSETG